MSNRSSTVVKFEEVTKVYEKEGAITAFDTDIFHIRIENIGRSKSMDAIMRKLGSQLQEGTLSIPVSTEN